MLHDVVPAQQILAGVATDLEARLLDAAGNPALGLTPITVTVTRADGTVLYTDQTATDNTDGTYKKALVVADVATLDVLVATWKVAGAVRATTLHEIVGGFYFTEGDVNTVEAGRASLDGSDFTTLRRETESECERMTCRAFVPRYSRYYLDGAGSDLLIVPDPNIRAIREVRLLDGSGTFTAISSTDLALMRPHRAGMIGKAHVGSSDGKYFPVGFQNVIVAYEHGLDAPPPDLRRAAIRRFRSRSNKAKSAIPDRALSYTAQNGATYRIATPDEYSTGDPDTDAAYEGYQMRRPAFS